MRRFRFSLATLLVSLPILAISLAALRYSNEDWASAMFTTAVVVCGVAVVGALVRRGKARAFWTGFAVLGWSYLILSFGPWFEGSAVMAPPLFSTRALAWIYRFANAREGKEMVIVSPHSQLGKDSPLGGMVIIDVEDRANARFGGESLLLLTYSQVGHSLATLLLGLIGGLVGLVFAHRNDAERRGEMPVSTPPSGSTAPNPIACND